MSGQTAAVKAQQEQLQQRLVQLGIDVPVASVPLFPPGSHLGQWLLQQTDEHIASSGELKSRPANGKAPSDLAQVADQGSHQGGLQGPGQQQSCWLADTSTEQQQLEDARAMERALHAQLAELQAVDRAMGSRLQDTQAAQQELAALLAHNTNKLSAQKSAMQHLNTLTNELLQALLTALQEIERQICTHGGTWLAIAADMAQYKRTDELYNHHLHRLSYKLSGRELVASGAGSSAPGSSLPLSPYSPVAHREGLQLQAGRSRAEHDARRQEMLRLRTAFCLGEVEEVMARAKLAGLQAQVAQLRQMMAEQQSAGYSHTYAPWLQPAECDRLASRVQELHREATSLAQRNLPALIDEVGKLQDVDVLQSEYQQQAAHKEATVRDMQAVLAVMQAWGGQSLVLDTIRMAERGKLNGMYQMMNDLTEELSELLVASHKRCAMYDRPAAAALAGGGTCPGTPGAMARSPTAAVYQASRQGHQSRQQLEDHSFLDTLHGVLHHGRELTPSQGLNGVGTAPPPSTLQALTGAISSLQAELKEAQAAAAQLSGERLPQLSAAAVAGARAAHATLCGPQATGVVPIMSDPELVAAQATMDAANDKFQTAVNEVIVMGNAVTDPALAQRPSEHLEVERCVLAWFYTKPDKLNDLVTQLQDQLDALQATSGNH